MSAVTIVKRIEIGNVSVNSGSIVIAMASAVVAHVTNVPAMTDVAEAAAMRAVIAIVIAIDVREIAAAVARPCKEMETESAVDLVISVVAVAHVINYASG